jgi:hypothetical protein
LKNSTLRTSSQKEQQPGSVVEAFTFDQSSTSAAGIGIRSSPRSLIGGARGEQK